MKKNKNKGNPIVRKKKKWYNKITKRYVSESTAKRYNSFYKRNPNAPHSRAYGNYGFKEKKKYNKQGTKLQRLIRKDNQYIKTKNKKGETIYYSPFEKKNVSKKTVDAIKKLDYTLLNGAVNVRLHRLTKDNNNIYHVWSFPVKMSFQSGDQMEIWLRSEGIPIINEILKDVKNKSKTDDLGKNQNVYGYFDARYYSDIDTYKAGTTFGFARPTMQGLRLVGREFKNIVLSRLQRLNTMSYHMIRIESVNIYLWNHATETNIVYAKYRRGVIAMDYYK